MQESLWREYVKPFSDFDDLTLARWVAQTLGQLEGKSWRLSHPLVRAYHLASNVAHDRQIWFKRLATAPAAYTESPCCRAPFLPMLTREIMEIGLVCQYCGETVTPFDEIPKGLRDELLPWSKRYSEVHAVAHWEDEKRLSVGNYDDLFEDAADEAELLLRRSGRILAPKFLEFFPAVIWEDQDECLSVLPEEIEL
jgi:FAD/FMN-containing dehydrogenase